MKINTEKNSILHSVRDAVISWFFRIALRLLNHTIEPLPGGGEVVLLNTGAIIGSEAQAMLGALHSRSPGGIRSHLKILAKKGAKRFMRSFYVGYGHKSIGDLANGAIFIEGVSMLVAKAVQDFALYNGQEVSTRYVDFSTQRFVNPLGTNRASALLERWRAFYLSALTQMIPVLEKRFPRNEGEKEADWKKAVKARAFDTVRSLLPAGATTNLVWTGSFRQMADRLPVLRHHPLAEVRVVAEAVERVLVRAFPDSFSLKRYEATEAYVAECNELYAYFDDPDPVDFDFRDTINHERLVEYNQALIKRPPKTELPYALRDAGVSEFRLLLDFGSFRDIQRHRAVSMRMPLLTANHGFEEWYLQELPDELRAAAEALIKTQTEEARELCANESPTILQYYLPMGYRTTIRLTGDLRALVYLVEIRATRFVHPTLRVRAAAMAKTLEQTYATDGLVLHLDADPDRFDVKRGTHDITLKA